MIRKALFAALLLTAACETTRGMGRDLESAGRAVQNAVP